MKKMALLLAASLVVATAVPAFAEVDLNGKLRTELKFAQDDDDLWGLTGKTGLDLNAGISTPEGVDVRAVVELRGSDEIIAGDDDGVEDDPAGDFTDPNAARPDASMFDVAEARLEATGAFWHGGPAVKTSVGDLDLNWNRYVLHPGAALRGASVERVPLGPVEARSFYAVTGLDRTIGLQLDAIMDAGRVTGTLVNQGGDREAAVEASLLPLPGVWVDGVIAFDRDQDHLYKVEVTSTRVPGVTLMAGYRAADADTDAGTVFDPIYTDNEAYDTETGFNVGVATTQAGITLAAEYDNPTDTAELSARTRVNEVDLTAAAKVVERSLDEAKLSAAFSGVPYVDVVTVDALVRPDAEGEENELEVGAGYRAPNGISMGARYNSLSGPYVTAALEAAF